MKKIIYIFALVIIGTNIISCDNDEFLNNKPLDKFSELDVWTDGNLAEGFVFDIYRNVVKDLYANQNTDDWTDNIVNNDDNGFARQVQNGSFENTADFGWWQYSKIRRCNIAIEKLSDPESPIDESVKTRLIAESKMMRAMTYYWMARRFGGVMIVDKVLTAEDDLKLPRSSDRETYDFILADLEYAVENLPPTTAEKGRLTEAAANAFITMVALQIGDYDKVIAAADNVEGAGFSLEPEYKNLFNNFAGTVNSNEVILIYYIDEEKNNFIDTRMFRNLTNIVNGVKLHADAVPQLSDEDEFQGWPLRWPSQELVDSYLVKEGANAVEKKYTEFQGKLAKNMWKDRDNRFEVSIVRDSAVYSKSTFTYRKGGNAHWTSNPLSSWGMSKSGYMLRKWMYEDQFFFWNFPVDWAEPILRLGEVYLNKAEAYGRKKDFANAIVYLNKTRTTHGGLPELDAGVSEAEFWKYYKIERRVELAIEDDRYWSLVRWAKAEDAIGIPELNGYKLHAQDMEFDGLSNVIESPFTVDMNFQYPKRLLFPIPNWEILNNSELDQNPGWE